MPVYEHLMLSASRHPEKLKEIDQVINKLQNLNPEIIDDFMPVWNVFKEFAKK